MRPVDPKTCVVGSIRQDIYAGATKVPYDPEGNAAEEAMKALEAEYGPYETYDISQVSRLRGAGGAAIRVPTCKKDRGRREFNK